MNKKQIALLNNTINALQEGTKNISAIIKTQRIIEQRLVENGGLVKRDGSRMAPVDLYNACREMASAYGGDIAKNLNAATNNLYAAYQASLQQQKQQQQQQPQQQAQESARHRRSGNRIK